MALMYYLIYKTTNTITGKFYIGTHKPNNRNDGYMGSGKYLNHAIKKYGIENFTKEILFEFDNSEDMFAKEAEIVNEDFLATENTYNLKKGGFGGFDYINQNNLQGDSLYTKLAKENSKYLKNISEDGMVRMRQGRVSGGKVSGLESRNFKKGIHNPKLRSQYQETSNSPEAIAKKKETWKINNRGKGENNSQFGTCWITNEIEDRKINKNSEIPDGWRKGRK